jgi:hypothetical protein
MPHERHVIGVLLAAENAARVTWVVQHIQQPRQCSFKET